MKQLRIILLLIAGCCLMYSCKSSQRAMKKSPNLSHNKAEKITAANLPEEQQRKYNYFFLEAMRQKGKNNLANTFGLLQHCLAINPDAPSALYEIAQYYLYLRQIPQGQEALERAVRLAPDNYWYAQGLALLYQQQKQTDKAILLLENMVKRFPTKQDPLVSLLDLYNSKEEYGKVIETLDLLESRVGKNERFSVEKCRIYLQMGEEKKAFAEIEGLIKQYPLDTRYQLLLGDLYLEKGKKEEAYNMYQKILAEEPNNPDALFSLAQYYEITDQPQLYEAQLDTLLINNNTPSETKLEVMRRIIIRNEQEHRDSTQVISLFEKAIRNDSDNDQINMLYAQYLLSKQMEDEAIPVLENVVRIDPTNKAARMMLLSPAIKKEDYKRVIEICEPGTEATPDALEFYFYLAVAYNQAEKTDSVISVCRKALAHTTENSKKEVVSDFYSILGDMYHTKDMKEEAYAAYDSSLVYNPSNIGTLNNYAYFLSLEKRDLDKAEEMSYKTVKAEPNNATYLDTYAWILFEKGNYTQARIYIDNALKTEEGKQSSVVLEHGGDIYIMCGETEIALKYWKQALELGSESKTLQKKIESKQYIAEKQ